MKKFLLSIICFLACIISIHGQTLYGLTPNGGSDGVGTLIKFIPATNNLTVPKSFENYASSPYYTHIIQASNGKLYGMTLYGGDDNIGGTGYGGGVIFSFDPSSSTYTKLKNFDGTNGSHPNGSLMQASDGKLYGMTTDGGSNYGVIFSFDPSSSTYTKLKDFDHTNGAYPYGSLVQASDGKLYGMTNQGGSSNRGVIFSFNPSSSIYSKLVDFDFTNGAHPDGNLMQASDGKLYGMTHRGGSSDAGVIFSLDPLSSFYTKLKDFDFTNGVNYYYGSAFIEVTTGTVVTSLTDITNSLHEVKVFPNPASGIAIISFFLDKPEKVSVEIFDITGRKAKGLVEKKFPQGESHVQWNTSGIQAGMYFLKIDAGVYSDTKKLSVIK